MTGIFVQFNTDSHMAKTKPVGWIEDGSGCHIWIGSITGTGYGAVSVGGRMRAVHRVRYEREVGPIPNGMELDHYRYPDLGCVGPSCCNPSHVRPVTPRENSLRGNTVVSGHTAKTHCPAGHALSADNLVPSVLLRGHRNCRTCKNETNRKYRDTKKAACDGWNCAPKPGHLYEPFYSS